MVWVGGYGSPPILLRRVVMARTDEPRWKRIVASVKAGSKGGNPGQWSARKAQMLAAQYKKAGGGYRD